ncbi:MAG: ribose 5-phosphate isomerase B [Candidatus Eisenbacteria bacterium]|nr:ribose 5-phosphate isomerase B [Candidatus Eisenbacteria bacterium]
MKVAVGADHAGFEMKEAIKSHLKAAGHEVLDFGTDSAESTDYPDYGAPAARSVAKGEAETGILFCGSGEGMTMVANKVKGVRAALVWRPDVARLSRLHNDANVLSLPARFVTVEQATEIVDTWLSTGFEGGRHVPRVKKMMSAEEE